MPVIVGHKTQVSAVLSLIELAKAVQLHRHTVTDQDWSGQMIEGNLSDDLVLQNFPLALANGKLMNLWSGLIDTSTSWLA